MHDHYPLWTTSETSSSGAWNNKYFVCLIKEAVKSVLLTTLNGMTPQQKANQPGKEGRHKQSSCPPLSLSCLLFLHTLSPCLTSEITCEMERPLPPYCEHTTVLWPMGEGGKKEREQMVKRKHRSRNYMLNRDRDEWCINFARPLDGMKH